jgi:agmatinase
MGRPTYFIPSTFMDLPSEVTPETEYVICGIPFDYGTSNRPGTRFGPPAIRSASRMLIDGDHPYHWVNPMDLPIADVGDLDVVSPNVLKSLEWIEEDADEYKHLITLGGDHTISLPLLRAIAKRHGPVAMIHFDAHVDTWPPGTLPLHGNPFYFAIEENLVNPEKMVQIGIRSPVNKSVYDWTIGKGVQIWSASEVHEQGIDVVSIADHIKETIGDTPVYLTIDIDCLDPSVAPGTGTPEVGGLTTWQVQTILRNLTGMNFIGMDMVEVAPDYDISEITALAAATFVWEYLALLKVGKSND